MAEVWKNTLQMLKKDSSFGNMFHMMERFGNDTAAEMTDKSGVDHRRTYADYVLMSKIACGNLQKQAEGKKGDFIGLSYDTDMDWPVLMWGILMSGYNPLLLNPLSDEKLNEEILSEAGAVAYVAQKPMAGAEKQFISAESLLSEGECGEEVWGEYVALCTSGTTGSSRIFLYDAQTIANHIISFDEAKKLNPDMPFIESKTCKLLAFLPFHHVFGFSVVYLLYSCTGKTLVYVPERSSQAILEACKKHGVTHLYCIPMFFNALANGIKNQLADKDIHNLPWLAKQVIQKKTLGTKIRSMITGGGHIPEETLDILNSVGYPLCNGFGMTETGIICVEKSLDAEQRKKGSVGEPFTLTEWKIDAEDGKPGEFCLRGGALYAASVIDGKIVPRNRDEWFYTGDLVVKKPDGLYFVGRLKDVIVGANGENIYPEDLEDTFAGIDGVRNLCMVGIKNNDYETVCLVVEGDGNDKKICDEIRNRSRSLAVNSRPTRVYFSEEKLPVSGSMKVKRQLLKREIEGGRWPCSGIDLYKSGTAPKKEQLNYVFLKENPEYESTEEFKEILSEVREAASKKLSLPTEKIGDTDHFVLSLGGDSLILLDLFTELEEKYNITIPDDEMDKLENCYITARMVYCRKHGIEG